MFRTSAPKPFLERTPAEHGGTLADLQALIAELQSELAAVTFLDGFSRFDLRPVTVEGQILTLSLRVGATRPEYRQDIVMRTRRSYNPGWRAFGRPGGSNGLSDGLTIPVRRVVSVDPS